MDVAPTGTPPRAVPPAPRHDRVDRPSLLRQLDEVLDRGVGLVSAAPGSGTSTLLAAWVATLAPKADVAWLALEAQHDDPAILADHLWIAASRHVALPRSASPLDVVVAVAAACGRRQRPLVLVLDDAHHLPQDAATAFDWLLAHRPEGLSVVMAGRQDPPLAWHVVRGHGDLVELHDRDLALDRAEVVQLLDRRYDVALVGDEADEVLAKTGGWATGAVLAGIAWQHDAVDTSQAEYVARLATYVDHEVVGSLSEDLVAFMEDTAVFDDVDPRLCDVVTGRANSFELLRSLANRRLFTQQVTNDPPTFRYHPVLRARLRQRLDARDPMRSRDLVDTASRWYEEHDQAGPAIELALLGDTERAARLIRTASGRMLRHGYSQTVHRWVGKLPERLVWTSPDLTILTGLASSDPAVTEAAWLTAHRALDEADEPATAHLRIALARLELDVLLSAGRLDSLTDPAGRAVAIADGLSPDRDHAGLDREALEAWAAMASLLGGAWQQAADRAWAAVDPSRIVRPTSATVLALGVRALALAWLGEPEARHAIVLGARSLRAFTGPGCEPLLLHVAAAWVDADMDAGDSLAAARARSRRPGHPHQRALVALATARRDLHRGAATAAVHALDSADEAIRALAEPGALAGVAKRLREELGLGPQPGDLALADRELEVLHALATGASRPEIAKRLHLSVNTVKTHLQHAYRKLDAHDRDEAIERARSHGLLPDHPHGRPAAHPGRSVGAVPAGAMVGPHPG